MDSIQQQKIILLSIHGSGDGGGEVDSTFFLNIQSLRESSILKEETKIDLLKLIDAHTYNGNLTKNINWIYKKHNQLYAIEILELDSWVK